MDAKDQSLENDIAHELEQLAKCSEQAQVAQLVLPTLGLVVDVENWRSTEMLDSTLHVAIESCPEYAREPLRALLADGQDRWTPLKTRGEIAASELGISYDGLRRRNAAGIRKLDSLFNVLASAVIKLHGRDAFDSPSTTISKSTVTPEMAKKTRLFLSYSRADDAHEGQFISAIREQVSAEFRFQTGSEIEIFQDKVGIDAGEPWQRRLDEAIDSTDLLLVFLTPSYLASTACIDELDRFLKREKFAGRDDLILVVYYAQLPQSAADSAAASDLLKRQYVDWRPLRFESQGSVPVRKAVAHLANGVAQAIDRTGSGKPQSSAPTDEEIDDAGFVERLAEMEIHLPRLVRIVEEMTETQTLLTADVSEASERATRLNSLGKGGSARLMIARQLAKTLEPYAHDLDVSSRAYLSTLVSVGGGIEAMAEMVPYSDEEDLESVIVSLISALDTARDEVVGARDSYDAMDESYDQLGRLSSSLRPVLSRMARSMRVIPESAEDLDRWSELLQLALSERPPDAT
ncbi:toll/interleukin-1 receptor domain-containing protein [Acidimicrobiaceae bacterium AH-315-P05]|nr:toll/interleukin-1 receptor domain-containing protein [Acidimicrobiaceae bacterium AH-315-P05]